MRTNYVLIDYENVQPDALTALEADHFKVIVFVGANQTKIGIDAAAALQRMGDRAAYVKMSGNGKNAADFHIAFYVGQFAALDPKAYFHIISNDTGFDPLIHHLKTKQVFASRWRNVCEIPLVKIANSESPAERLAMIVERLKRFGKAKPGTVKTLSSTINSLFQKQLTENELAALIEEMQAKGLITANKTKVSYTLPESLGQ